MFVERDFTKISDVQTPHVAETAAEDGQIEASLDVDRGIIFVGCRGKWSPAQIDAAFAQTHNLIDNMRANQKQVRVLVDRRLAVPQSEATIQRLKEHTERGYLLGDKIAVLVDSSLSKMQLRPQIDPTTHKLFISESAASLWLGIHD